MDPRRAQAAEGVAIRLTPFEQARMWGRIALLLLAVLSHVPMHYLLSLIHI